MTASTRRYAVCSQFPRGLAKRLIFAAALGSLPVLGFDQAIWVGTHDGNWSDPANWNLNLVPNNSADHAYRCLWTTPPVAITIDVPVTVISLTHWAGGTLNIVSDLHFTDGMTWTKGTITGTGQLLWDNGIDIERDVAGTHRVLDGYSLTVAANTVLGMRSSLELVNRPGDGRFSHINIQSGGRLNTVESSTSLEVTPEGTRSHVDNAGTVHLLSPLTTQADLLNHQLLSVEQTTLTLENSDVLQDAGSLTLSQGSILNNSTNPDHGRVILHGGSVGGSGQIDVARIGEDGGAPVAVSGQLHFKDVAIADSATYSVHLGGSLDGQFDNLSASQKLTWHPRLEVDVVNGFENSILGTDVFEIISAEPGAIADGAFGNVALGQRIKVGNFGTMLVDHAAGNPASVVLRDYHPIQFSVAINGVGNSSYYPLPVEPFPLMDNAGISELSPVDWPGGMLDFALTANYDANEDHLLIQAAGNGPGQISAVRDPGDDTQMKISFGGVPFATGTGFMPARDVSSGAQLLFHLEANATKDAIQALMRSCLYTNDTYRFEAFTNDLLRVFPQRTFQVTLTDPAGFHAADQAPVNLPKVLQLACIPDSVYITPSISKQLTAEAIFDNPQRSESLLVGTQIHYGLRDSCGAAISFTPVANNHSAVVVAVPPDSGVETDCTIVASVGPLSAYACAQIRIVAPWVQRCILDDADADTFPGCDLSPFAPAGRRQPHPAGPSGPIALAGFRALETLMSQTAEGRRLVDLYWRHSNEWVAICILNSFGHTGMFAEVRGVLQRWQAYVNALLAGKGSGAAITQPMITSLNQLWDHVLTFASPELKADMNAERERFHGFQDFVGKTFDQWAELLQIPVPTTPWVALSHPRIGPDGFQAEANYVPGVKYSLLRSPNFVDWAPVAVTAFETNSATATLDITDPSPPPSGAYYKLGLVIPPP